MKQSRPLIVTLAILWIAAGWVEGSGNIKIRDATIRRLEGPELPIQLPFGADSSSHGGYRVKGTLVPLAGMQGGAMRIKADDCVETVKIDGKELDLSRFTREQRCDWRTGIVVAPASAVAAKGSALEVVITNLGGPYSFAVEGPFASRGFTIQRLESMASQLILPYFDSSDPTPATYLIKGTIDFGRLSHRRARFVADDCLVSVTIHGKAVDLSNFAQSKLCDWENGVTLDLSNQLENGPNAFEAVFKNIGGNFAFRVVPAASPFSRLGRLVQYLAFLWTFILLWPRRKLEAAVFALGAMLRLDFILSLHAPETHVFSDSSGYLGNALEMATGKFASHQLFQGVGYPLLLAATLRFAHEQYWLIHCVQWATSVLSVWLAWRASERLLGRRHAAWVLVLLSFHFPFISLSGFFMAETLYGLFIAVLFYLLARHPFPWSTLLGFALGAVFMLGHSVKGLGAFFAPISFAWAAVWAWRRGARTPSSLARVLARPFGAFTAGVFVIVIVTAVTTRSLWGRVVLSAPTGGLNLVEGKCPAKINKDSEGYGWQSPLFAQLGENKEKVWPRPFSDQGFFWRAGFQCILDNPAVLLTSLEYVVYLFAENQLWPSNQTYPKLTRDYGMFYTTILCPGILLALLLLLRRPFHRSRLPYLIGVAILFGSWVLKSEMRYRIPFDVVFLPMAVMGWSWLLARLYPKLRGDCSLKAFALALGLWVTISIYV